MAELIVIEGRLSRRAQTVEQAWDAFVLASAKAKTSERLEDGIAAGKAYADFLDLFHKGEQRRG
jgi:hypothetical protein